MQVKKLIAAATILAASFSAQADITILGGKLYAADTGMVTVTFLGSDAGYTDILLFNELPLFNGHATAVDTTINLGIFTAGTELQFRLNVNDTGNSFFTGPPSSNFDGVFHASAVLDSHKSAIVGFEDLQGGGDQDYNDLQFRVTNVSNVSAVPEPTSYAMMLGGLGLIGFLARRRRASQNRA